MSAPSPLLAHLASPWVCVSVVNFLPPLAFGADDGFTPDAPPSAMRQSPAIWAVYVSGSGRKAGGRLPDNA